MWTYTYMDIERYHLLTLISKRGINIALINGAIPEHRTDGNTQGHRSGCGRCGSHQTNIL